MRIAGWIVVLILSVAAVLTLNPDWIGVLVPPWAELSTRFPISQAIAVRALPAGAFVLVGVIILIVALVRKIGFRGGNRTLALALVLVLVGVGHAGYLWTRGLENPAELGPDRGLRPTEEGDGAITLLTYNTAGGRTTSEEVANLAEQSGADVLVLPEAGPEFAEQTASFLASADETYQIFTRRAPEEQSDSVPGSGDDGEDERPEFIGHTAVLVSSNLGEYVRNETAQTTLGALRVEPASGVGPVVVGVHAAAPVRDQHEEWLGDLETIMALCGSSGPDGVVVAGDFNATLDHAPMRDLGRCVDASVEAGIGGIATWPSNLPQLVGAPIDHVLVDAAAYEVGQGRVDEAGDSDHRGLVVRIRPTT
ncbi:endonuclease/exonuclease/phosphatase family protein [Georgenia deserti]|uniref:Endonuclease/exonuclease/phosphatase family protein n=1 Tax=Georgenia deserti TaxID=2093781 RepID=A0ABW4L385_9MICO